MRREPMHSRSPQLTLVLIVLVVAGAGVAAAFLIFGMNMVTGFISMAAVLVATVVIVGAPWIASRSAGPGVAYSVGALAIEAAAALLLLTSPPSNSHLWVPINIGRFGGFVVAGLGLALTLHAAALRRLDRRAVLALLAANLLAIALGIGFAGWENRS